MSVKAIFTLSGICLGSEWNEPCYVNGLIQDCVYSSAFAMELLQTCAKPLIWSIYGPGHEGVAVLLPGFAII